MYDCDSIKMQVNDIFEFIGFLSLRINEESMDEQKDYYDALPRIHVISMTHISSVFDNMLCFQKGCYICVCFFLILSLYYTRGSDLEVCV